MPKFATIETPHAPRAIGPYSQATLVGNFIFLSGQIGLDPTTSELVPGGCEAQLQQVFKNIEAVLAQAKISFDHVVKLTVFLCDLTHFSFVNEMMKKVFQEPYPARSTIQVAGLPKEALVEIEIVAITAK
jgi:2-iminobutanoate/2-iminopropanoate deaminase